VQFQVDGSNLGGPVALVNGQASLCSANLSLGNHTITAVYSGDANFLPDPGSTPLAVLEPASLSGVVFADINSDGRMDHIDWGIAGVTVSLTGVDDLGHAVSLTEKTGGDGSSLFANLRAGNYTISEYETVEPWHLTPAVPSQTYAEDDTLAVPDLIPGFGLLVREARQE
jgi:hypothetical protein